jgi:hypothetical protein
LDWSEFPHAYFYGNWGAKVPTILQDKGIYAVVTIQRSREKIQEK